METGQKIIQQNNNIDQQSSNILSIQVSLNGLSFCILNKNTNTILKCISQVFEKKLNPQDVLDKLISVFNTEKILQQPFNNVKVIYDNELFTIVPKPLFNEDHLADYLKFNSRILQTDYITFDTLETNDSICVYVPYMNVNNYLYDRFGEFEYMHFSSVLITSVLNLNRNTTSETVYVNVNRNHFEIIVVENNSLNLFNTFEYHTKEDFIYYLLFAAEQLKLNPETFKLVLLGQIQKGDALYNIAYKYVRHVNLIESTYTFNVSSDIAIDLNQNFIMQHSF